MNIADPGRKIRNDPSRFSNATVPMYPGLIIHNLQFLFPQKIDSRAL